MHFLRIIKDCYPGDSWQELLTDSRVQSAMNLLNMRQARNEAISLADCLQFCDKKTIILRSPQILERIRFESQEACEHLLNSAEGLRDKLAHGQDLVLGSSWPEIIDLSWKIEALLERCEGIEIS
jgi:hypothetical protein